MTLSELKLFEDRRCQLTCIDGEVIRAKIAFVDTEYEDVIVDIESTTRPDKWPHGHPTSECAYTLPLSEIQSVEDIPG
jgi:hypothetical protein